MGLVMIEKYCDKTIPEVKNIFPEIIDKLNNEIWPKYNQAMEKFGFNHALDETWQFITYCDQIISDKKPWELYKVGKTTELNDLLHHLAEALRHIAVMIWPIMPETSEKIMNQLGMDVAKELSKPLSELQNWVQLTVGNKIDKGEPLFPRL